MRFSSSEMKPKSQKHFSVNWTSGDFPVIRDFCCIFLAYNVTSNWTELLKEWNGDDAYSDMIPPKPQDLAADLIGWQNNMDISPVDRDRTDCDAIGLKSNLKESFHLGWTNATVFSHRGLIFGPSHKEKKQKKCRHPWIFQLKSRPLKRSVLSASQWECAMQYRWTVNWNTALWSAWRPRRGSASSRCSGGPRTMTQSCWPPCSWPGSGSAWSPAASRTRWGHCRVPGQTRTRARGSSRNSILQKQHEWQSMSSTAAPPPTWLSDNDSQMEHKKIKPTWHRGVCKEEVRLHGDLVTGIGIGLNGVVWRTRICLDAFIEFWASTSLERETNTHLTGKTAVLHTVFMTGTSWSGFIYPIRLDPILL